MVLFVVFFDKMAFRNNVPTPAGAYACNTSNLILWRRKAQAVLKLPCYFMQMRHLFILLYENEDSLNLKCWQCVCASPGALATLVRQQLKRPCRTGRVSHSPAARPVAVAARFHRVRTCVPSPFRAARSYPSRVGRSASAPLEKLDVRRSQHAHSGLAEVSTSEIWKGGRLIPFLRSLPVRPDKKSENSFLHSVHCVFF